MRFENFENSMMYSQGDNNGVSNTDSYPITLNAIAEFHQQMRSTSLAQFFDKYQIQNHNLSVLVRSINREPIPEILPEAWQNFDIEKIGSQIRLLDTMTDVSLKDKFSLLTFIIWQDFISVTTATESHIAEENVQKILCIQKPTYESCMRNIRGPLAEKIQYITSWSNKLFWQESMLQKISPRRSENTPPLTLKEQKIITAITLLETMQDLPLEERLKFLVAYRVREYRKEEEIKTSTYKQTDNHVGIEFDLPSSIVTNMREEVDRKYSERLTRFSRWVDRIVLLKATRADLQNIETELDEYTYWVLESLENEKLDRYSWEQFTAMAQKLGFNYTNASFIALTSRLKRTKEKLVELDILDEKRGNREQVRIASFQNEMKIHMLNGINSSHKLADLLGVSLRTINNWKIDLELTTIRRGQITEENQKFLNSIRSVIKTIEGKKTNRTIAEALQKNGYYTNLQIEDLVKKLKYFLERYKEKAGIQERRNPNMTVEQQRAIDQLAISGLGPSEIARRLNLDQANVAYYMRGNKKRT